MIGRELGGVLPGALVTGLSAGLVLGLVRGWHYLAAGFPLLLGEAMRREGLLGTGAGAGFALLFAVAVTAARRYLSTGMSATVAAVVAALPLVAAGGYRLDREVGLRPSQLLEPRALKINLGYLALCLLAFLAVRLLLGRRRPGWGRRSLTAAAGAIGALGLLAGGVALGFRAGGEAGGDPRRPDIVFILIDALRADHLSSYGYHRPTSPVIDGLAADGVLFRQAVASSTFTKTSIASLFTGRHPFQHGVYFGNLNDRPGRIASDVLAAGEETLAEALRDAGYLTTAWVQNTHLQWFMGFDQGFVDYRDQQGRAVRILDQVGPFLEGPGRRYPFFAYIHLIDLHDPYEPEAPYNRLFGQGAGDPYAGVDLEEWGEYLRAVRKGEVTPEPWRVERMAELYDGLIRYLDDQLGRLLDDLRAAGLYEDSLIVLTSDHGDAFNEHGFISHSAAPYEELVRVPLVVKLPGGRHAGRVIDEPVRLIDLLPTLLAEAGARVPAAAAGCPLQPLFEGGSRHPACEEAVIEVSEDGAPPLVAVRSGGWKLIHRPEGVDELYDLGSDPGEQRDLAGSGLAEEERLLERARAALTARGLLTQERIELDEKTVRELKALGYLD